MNALFEDPLSERRDSIVRVQAVGFRLFRFAVLHESDVDECIKVIMERVRREVKPFFSVYPGP